MPSLSTFSLLLFMTAPLFAQTTSAPAVPPVAPIREVIDEYHGVKVTDPYRYMENLKEPEVIAWLKTQSAHTTAVLESIPGRAALLKRIQELDKGAPFLVSGLQRLENGTVFYRKLVAEA